MTQRFHTLTGLACSLLAIASAPAVWGILTLSVEGTYVEAAEREVAPEEQRAVEATVEVAAADTLQREDEQAGEETARP